MAGYGDRPWGIREIKLVSMDGTKVVTLNAAQKLSFKPNITSGEMRGNDQIVALAAVEDSAEWSLEAGGIPLEAWALMTGRTVVESGSTPNRKTALNMDGGRVYPYFKIYGKAVGETGTDDIHVKLYKCKLTEPIDGEFADGAFYVTSCSGKALPTATGIAEIVQNETAAALPAS
jgi:hypothetical protein